MLQPAVRLFLTICVAGLVFAQNTNSGDIRGIVKDASGAVVPDVKVSILNVDTGVVKDLSTNAAGLYDAVSLVPGQYQVTFLKEGFDRLVRGPITLTVGAISVDATLKVGAATQVVEVSAEAPLLKTETAEQARTFESNLMMQLPNVGQNWGNFTKLLPGASGAPGASQGAANPGTGVSVNGNLPFYSNFLADGANTTLPHSANVDISIQETLAEVQINTSTFSAQYGVGGAVFNQISKSGTNQWHGSLYEYAQNNAFNARAFFDRNVGNLRYHNFGGAVGGPVIKNKTFFYFNVDKIINNSASQPLQSVPTEAMKAGDFSNAFFPQIYDPNSLHTDPATGKQVRDPFPNNQIPANRVDPVAKNLLAFFPKANLAGTDAVSLANNFQVPVINRSPFLKFFGRLDHNITDQNRLTMSVTQRDNPAYIPSAFCPLNCQNGDVDSYNGQISDVWSITATTVNEFRMGFTRQGNWFTPLTLGQGYPEKLGIKYSKADVFPNINIGGPVGGNNILQPNTNAIYVENSFDPSDVVTLIRGRHILHFGGELLAFQDNSTPWGNVQSGQFTFSGVFTQRGPFDTTTTPGYANGRSGLGFADFLLGQVSGWNANNSPLVGGRQKSPQFFVQDDFKLRPNLTLQLGLRYQIQGGWSEIYHRQGAFDPTVLNPKTNTLGAMWFAPNNGRDAAEATDYKIFLPRVGFSWSPATNWAIRGGFGIYSYGWSLDTYAGAAMGFGANSVGNLSNTDQVQPLFLLSDANPPLNYVGASKDPAAYNNTGVNYVPYHTPVARVKQWSFSIQRQFGNSLAAEAAYVASHGSDLSFPTNLNQVPVDKLGQGQNARPYPQFQGIGGNTYNARSNYNSLQLSLRKRFSRGLNFEGNYTWAKFLSDQDSSGWGSRDGGQVWQDAYNPKANYGYSNFDVPHALKGSVLYQVPFGKGKGMFNHGLADAIVGGWQISSIFVIQSGQPLTAVVSGSNNSGALAGTWYPNVVGDPSVQNQTLDRWFNPDAFAIPAAFTFGNSGRNTLRGPSLKVFDLSMGKNFSLDALREGASVQFRFDAQNALNHPSFARPNAQIGNTGNVGRITGTTVGGRTLQLGARFSF